LFCFYGLSVDLEQFETLDKGILNLATLMLYNISVTKLNTFVKNFKFIFQKKIEVISAFYHLFPFPARYTKLQKRCPEI